MPNDAGASMSDDLAALRERVKELEAIVADQKKQIAWLFRAIHEASGLYPGCSHSLAGDVP